MAVYSKRVSECSLDETNWKITKIKLEVKVHGTKLVQLPQTKYCLNGQKCINLHMYTLLQLTIGNEKCNAK